MDYDADDLKNVLENLDEDFHRITYTEHFIEKVAQRGIDINSVDEKLLCEKPMGIYKIPDRLDAFIVKFKLEKGLRLLVFLKVFGLHTVILISAVSLREGYDEVQLSL